MSVGIVDELKVAHTRDEVARQGFLSAMRRYTLNQGAGFMKDAWEGEVAPAFAKEHGRAAQTQEEIHGALKHHPLFAFYSVMRTQIQRSVWRSVMPGVARSAQDLPLRVAELSRAHNRAQGTLEIKAGFEVPAYSGAIDVHQLPGSYAAEYMADDVTQGAVFEEGVAIVSMGFFGPKMHDIGESMALYVKSRWPDFKPKKILDLGCTVGHSTLPFAQHYADADVWGIDVGAGLLRYAHARAESLGAKIHFSQQNAERTKFADGSFDLVVSHILAHETSTKAWPAIIKECHRLLRPGGITIHLDLPQFGEIDPYRQFIYSNETYYNNEPFWTKYRSMNDEQIAIDAGFKPENVIRDFTGVHAGFDKAKREEAVAVSRAMGHGTPPGSNLGFAFLVAVKE